MKSIGEIENYGEQEDVLDKDLIQLEATTQWNEYETYF